MNHSPRFPTPYPEVNLLLQELLSRIRHILNDRFVGLYLDGSLAIGGFDQDSDIDFIVVADSDAAIADRFDALQAMHAQFALAHSASPYATDIEGFYVSQSTLRTPEQTSVPMANLERGREERLKWRLPDASRAIHRAVLWERGIVLDGPAPHTLLAPVAPGELRATVPPMLAAWEEWLTETPQPLTHRGYQSYITLSLCRTLYTHQNGGIASKPDALEWAKTILPNRYLPLLEQAWEGRHHSQGPASSEDIAETLALLRWINATVLSPASIRASG